jgi:proline dehydrogenase
MQTLQNERLSITFTQLIEKRYMSASDQPNDPQPATAIDVTTAVHTADVSMKENAVESVKTKVSTGLSTGTSSPIDFGDTQTAFAYKSDGDLKKAHLLFSSLKYNFLVKMGPPLVGIALDLNLPIDGLLHKYFFKQFCGGIDLPQTVALSEQLHQFGVSSTLDYSVEAVKNEFGFEQVAQEVKRMIDHAAQHPAVSHIATKITGLGSTPLLEKAQMTQLKLKGSEKQQFDQLYARLESICQYAADRHQTVLLDAEESWIQEPIDFLAEEMMFKFNRDYPVVYTTAQMYRKDRLDYLKDLYQRAQAQNIIPAVKLVRGAYVEKENERAKSMGYPSPLNPTKAHTDQLYNQSALFILQHIDRFALYAGTHNEHSCQLIVDYVRSHHSKIPPYLYFSQLYGMSDHITFNLAKMGFPASKYLPYGPLRSVMPYLFRRAQENSSIAGQTGRELALIEKELHRRKKNKTFSSPQLNYKMAKNNL